MKYHTSIGQIISHGHSGANEIEDPNILHGHAPDNSYHFKQAKKVPSTCLLPLEYNSHSEYEVFEDNPTDIIDIHYTAPDDFLVAESPAGHEYSDWFRSVDGSPFMGVYQPQDEILGFAIEKMQSQDILQTSLDALVASSSHEKPPSRVGQVLPSRRSERVSKLQAKYRTAVPQFPISAPQKKQTMQPKSRNKKRGLEDSPTRDDEVENPGSSRKKRRFVANEPEIGDQDDGDRRFTSLLDDALSEHVSKEIVSVKGKDRETKYVCPEATSKSPCYKSFKSSREAQRHWGSVHVATSTLLPVGDERRCELLKLLKCPSCSRLLSRRDSLKRHVKQKACGKRGEYGPMRDLRVR